MRARTGWVAALAAGLLAIPGTASPEAVQVVVNGQPVAFTGAQPAVESGRVMIPIRGVLSRLGADTVDWDPATQTVAITQGERVIRLKVGRPWATTGRTAIPLDAPPILRSGRVLVPLRFVGEALGANVSWRPSDRTVVIVAPTGSTVDGTREVQRHAP